MNTCTFDIECDGLLDTVSVVWCGCVKDHDTGDIRSFGPDDIDSLLHLLDSYNTIIGHNCIEYDLTVLKRLYNWEYKGEIFDTLIASRTQRPNRTAAKGYPGKGIHSVEAWGYKLGEYKKEHEDWSQFSKEMLERCQRDVEIQFKIYHALLDEGAGEGWDQCHRLNMRLHYYLARQEEYGWKVDVEHMDRSLSLLSHWMGRIARVINPRLPLVVDCLETKKDGEYGWVKKPFNKSGDLSAVSEKFLLGHRCDLTRPRISGPFTRINIRRVSLDSNMETKDYLLSQGWKPAKWNTNDRDEKTSPNLSKDDPFDGIQSSIGRLVARRIICRQRSSVLSGWKNAIRHDGRLSPRISGYATTGRLRHKLIVNVPSPHSKSFFAKQMRQCFIASDGMVMVGCDSKGNQMRQLAGRMDDDEFTEAVLHGNSSDGTDLHSLNQRRSGAATRSQAKNFFYGSILFGAGNAKTAKILECNVEKAKAIKESYFNEMPKLKAVIDGLVTEWRTTAVKTFNKKWNRIEYNNGYIRGLDNRPILVAYEKDLLCYALQSDEAIQMAAAYVVLHKWAEKEGWEMGKDWGMLIWMHDEFQMEARPELANQLGQMAADAIKWAGEWFKIKCPHDGDYDIGLSWYDTH